MDRNGLPPTPVKSIGVPMPMVDGPEKISGRALYTADFYDHKNDGRRALPRVRPPISMAIK